MLIKTSLQLCLNILYEATTSGLLYGITFTPEYFVRPRHITIPNLLTNLNQNVINTTNIPTCPPTILDENSSKYIFRDVYLNHLST